MGATAAKAESLPDERLCHEALFYAGDEQFVEACVAFITAGLDAEEPPLVVALAGKLEKLREALGPDAERVQFADMDVVGRNPARIIPAWQEFVDENAEPGVRLRGIGEPIFPARDPHELVECERHEALLNLAFAGADRFWLMCPYDTEALPAPVIAEAKRNHPFVAHGEHGSSVPTFSAPRRSPSRSRTSCPSPRCRPKSFASSTAVFTRCGASWPSMRARPAWAPAA